MTSALGFPVPLGLHEQAIRDGMAKVGEGYREIGQALAAINTGRYFLHSGHATFAGYVHDVWGWSKQRAYQLINAEKLSVLLLDAGLEPPLNERIARPLTTNQLTPDEQILVWRVVEKVAADHNGKVTEKSVTGVINVLKEVTRTGAINVDGEAFEVAEAFQVMVSDEIYYTMLEQKKTLPGKRVFFGKAAFVSQKGAAVTFSLSEGVPLELGAGEVIRLTIYTAE